MRQEYRTGEKLIVDCAGQTMTVIDRHTGEIRQTQIFVAVLGASSYTFADDLAAETARLAGLARTLLRLARRYIAAPGAG